MDRPVIALTMGDPAGVGPEVCLRAAADPRVLARCVPVLFGGASLLARVARHCALPPPPPTLAPADWAAACRSLRGPATLDCASLDAAAVRPGSPNAACGRAALDAINAAIDAALAGQVAAVATAPINKESIKLAGSAHAGHTELLAERTRAKRHCMMLTSADLTVSLVTTHAGYCDVPALLSTARILDAIELTAEAVRAIRGRPPRLVVCGLNPHAGESGLFGRREEELVIAPAVAEARKRGLSVEGPLPPDTAFVPARRGRTDAYVCMYHDQGLIPLKALAFDTGVNVTLGLPIVRTSADHGTAFDIAWTGQASCESMVQAILLAAAMGAGRGKS